VPGRQLSLLPAVPLAQPHPVPVVCPVCGRQNPVEKTFTCRRCGNTGLCRRHLDIEARMCSACAQEDAEHRRRVEADRASRAQPHPIYSRWPFDAAEARRRQEVTAAALRIPVERDLDLGGGVTLTMALIPAGQFDMGSPTLGQDQRPGERLHRVRITKPFYIGKCPVTQDQWQAVMGTNPSHFQGARLPVEGVSWHDCRRFAETLNARAGPSPATVGLPDREEGYTAGQASRGTDGGSSVPRSACPTVPLAGEDTAGQASRGTIVPLSFLALPTEAQWECACRAGAKTRFCFADADAYLDQYAWYNANSADTAHPVGEKRPNAWGLHDLHGNVWEWCSDWYELGYYEISPERDPVGPAAGGERVARGGSWSDPSTRVRCAQRNHFAPSHKDACLGFRLVAGIQA